MPVITEKDSPERKAARVIVFFNCAKSCPVMTEIARTGDSNLLQVVKTDEEVRVICLHDDSRACYTPKGKCKLVDQVLFTTNYLGKSTS